RVDTTLDAIAAPGELGRAARFIANLLRAAPRRDWTAGAAETLPVARSRRLACLTARAAAPRSGAGSAGARKRWSALGLLAVIDDVDVVSGAGGVAQGLALAVGSEAGLQLGEGLCERGAGLHSFRHRHAGGRRDP